jgi:molybdopterin-biosynthesis enzyme MoeA-like protein
LILNYQYENENIYYFLPGIPTGFEPFEQKEINDIKTFLRKYGKKNVAKRLKLELPKNKKGKRNKIIEELIWTKATMRIAKRMQNVKTKQCKENSDCYVECDDDCNSGDQCTNKRIQNKMWKSVVKKMTENGK